MNSQHRSLIIVIIAFITCITILQSCKTDNNEVATTTPYLLNTNGNLPQPLLPADNPLTEEGVQLGRMLFYENALSRDGSQACASCHLQATAFVDSLKLSIGVQGLEGRRNSMPLFNLAWHNKGFFWDGRAKTLREQALLPIQDELEMDETLDKVINKLTAKNNYLDQFELAFGDATITEERIGLAIEQFMISLVSADAKYDKWKKEQATFTESELRGYQLFFTESNPQAIESGADCFHCHGGDLFTNAHLMNNGLDTDAEFTDLGLYEVTGLDSDKAKFKVPSLRNVALTPPYMHDGRFETLTQVLNHYNSGAKESSTLDPNMHAIIENGLQLSEQDMADIINFLHTLTDETYLNNPAYSNPFE